MHDRQPTPGQEGRMLITPENGAQAFFAKVQMADNPLDEGTPLNTATLLKQQTAALFGLGATAVPDDVLAYLGQYNLHWWQRREVGGRYEKVVTAVTDGTYRWVFNSSNGIVYSYSDSVSISTTGVVSLGGTVKTFTAANVSEFNTNSAVLVGRYFTASKKVLSVNHSEVCLAVGAVYYIPSGATFNTYSGGAYTGVSALSKVTSKYTDEIGDWKYLHSSDRNAYPDSGESDGYEWKYLGVPFDNAVTAPKIETGSYVGTGGAGPANANSFTFETPPILMAFVDKKGALLNLSPSGSVIVGICFPYLLTTEYQQYGLFQYSVWEENYGGSKSFYAKKSADGKTISWYSTSYYPTNQFNAAGITYNLVAICMGG